jgi:hypothetical protein
VSRVDVSFDWGRSESQTAGGPATIDRSNLRAAYTRALTSDWNVTGGVLLRHRKDASIPGSAQSNAVFVTLGRNFSFRP